jgi:hypothetical protein
MGRGKGKLEMRRWNKGEEFGEVRKEEGERVRRFRA